MSHFKNRIPDLLPPNECSYIYVENDEPPAQAFLTEAVNICESLRCCTENFPRLNSGEFNPEAESAFQVVAASAFALLMSHFETYQKRQVAVLINHFYDFNSSDEKTLNEKFQKDVSITVSSLLSEIGEPREPGYIIADCLRSWQNPEKVNSYFQILFKELSFYSNDDVMALKFLWQIRHSISHSSGIVTRPDSIKIKALRQYRDKKLRFQENFILETTKYFHSMLQKSLGNLEGQVRKDFIFESCKVTDEGVINSMCGCKLPNAAWFSDKS